MANKTRYTLVGKRGNEIFSADSFLGYVGGLIAIAIGSVIFISIIAAIVCGIGSLFK
jgi:hypothetical protein